MRKVIVSMNVTLDGFMAGPHCELDWHFNYWNEEMAKCAIEQLRNTDTILLGRVTYKAMAKYWPAKAMDLSYPREDIAFAGLMNSYTKIVFSKTLENLEWNNSKLIRNNTRKEIMRLKKQSGKDIIIYGSGSIVSALTQWGLIDEYVLWIHPVFIGRGKTLFCDVQEKPMLKLVNTKTFGSGVVILHCETVHKSDSDKDTSIIGKTFQELIAQPDIDKNGLCLEMYLSENDMRCLIKLF